MTMGKLQIRCDHNQLYILNSIYIKVVQLEGCLKHIFAKYCYPPVERSADSVDVLLSPPPNAYLTEEALEKWALETNGEPISQETKEEIMVFFDLNDDGNLTYVFFHSITGERVFMDPICLSFKGFLQLYQLQTENDEEETWKDLVRCLVHITQSYD